MIVIALLSDFKSSHYLTCQVKSLSEVKSLSDFKLNLGKHVK